MNLNKITNHRLLDKLWEFTVKSRAGFRCELCGDGGNGLDAHHILGRGLWLRWDTDNGAAVCRGGCHNKMIVLRWLKETDPRRYKRLTKKRNELHIGRKINLAAIERKLRAAG